MSGKCKNGCVTKKRYDDLMVENRALKAKIKELERGPLSVMKLNSSDPIDSGSAGFNTPNSPSPASDEYDSAPRYIPRRATRRGGKKKGSKKKKSGKGKRTKRVRG